MIMRLRKQKCFSSFSSRQNRRVLKRIIGACGRAPRASPNAAMTRTEVYAIHSFFISARNENTCVKLAFWKGLKSPGGDKKKHLLLIST